MRSRYPSAVSLPEQKNVSASAPDAVPPAEENKKTDTKTHRIHTVPTGNRFSVFDASAVQSELARYLHPHKKHLLFFQTVVLPHRTLHFHENENTEKSMVLRIPDADNICYSPESDTKILSRDAFHTFFRFFQTILFPKAYTASAIRNMFRGLYYEMHTVPSISFPPRRPAAKTERSASDPDPGFHILRSDLPSKNHLFYPVCLLVLHYVLYYTFLIRKKQALL